MNAHDAARAAAHALCAELLRQGIHAENAREIARIEAAGVAVIVQIVADGLPMPPIAPLPPRPALTPMMEQIVALLSKDKPAKAEWLAMKLGKKCGGSFRSICSDLVRLGVAKHKKGVGYFLA